MPDQNQGSVQRAVEVLANEYRSLGWQVEIDAGLNNFISLPSPYRADLLARRGDEVVVVEVKSRGAARNDQLGLQQLASYLTNQPHWKLRVVLVGEDERPAPSSAIRLRLASTRSLLDVDPAAALILGWATAEGLLAARAEAAALPLRRMGNHLLDELFDNDLLTEEEFALLGECYEVRSRAAHGREVGDAHVPATSLLAWLSEQPDLVAAK